VRQAQTSDPRNPDYDADWIKGTEQNFDDITSNLRSHPGQANTLPEAVYRLMSPGYLTTYNAFSSTQFVHGRPLPNYLSLEAIHGNIHGWTGGKGNMSHIAVAGFDPIFWLHHW
jgi:tyrosinase